MLKKKLQVLGLTGALILTSIASSQAFKIKIDKDTFTNISAQVRVFYLNKDKDKSHDYRYNRFQVSKFRIGAKGQINKLIQFYGMLDANYDSNTGKNPASLLEAGIQFSFSPKFVVKFGKIRVPFSRHNLTSRYVSPVMSSNGDIFLPDQFKIALKAIKPYPGGYNPSDPFKRTDFGTVIAGYIKNGLFKYYIGIFNGDKSNINKVWTINNGWDNATTTGVVEDKKGVEYDIRVEFTPTFWGFKSEKTPLNAAIRESQTYLGKFDTMTIGIGYHHEEHINSLNKTTYGTSSLTRDAIALDFSVEKKLAKKYITGLQTGYMYFHNTHFYETSPSKYQKANAWTWYLGGHFIYGEKIGMGYPGVGVRYEYIEVDGKYNNKSDLAYDRLGLCFSYWFSRSTRIATGVDFVRAKDALKEYLKANNYEYSTTDWYIGVFTQF